MSEPSICLYLQWAWNFRMDLPLFVYVWGGNGGKLLLHKLFSGELFLACQASLHTCSSLFCNCREPQVSVIGRCNFLLDPKSVQSDGKSTQIWCLTSHNRWSFQRWPLWEDWWVSFILLWIIKQQVTVHYSQMIPSLKRHKISLCTARMCTPSYRFHHYLFYCCHHF